MRLGFELFEGSPSAGEASMTKGSGANSNITFMPLAMPLMFGPGAIVTIIGMTSTVARSPTELLSIGVIVVAIFATTYVS